MELNELIGDFKFGLFGNLPPDMRYYVRGEGILARFDEIKNGTTRLKKNKLQLFFENQNDREEALRLFSETEQIWIVGDDRECIQLESSDFRLTFFRPEIQSAEKLVDLARITVFSPVITHQQNGEASFSSIEKTEKDVANRRIVLTDNSLMERTYKQMFKLANAGFEPSSQTLTELPKTEPEKQDPTLNWVQREKE